MNQPRRLPVSCARRPAFTLIELLVVIGIILLLFGLVYAFLPAVYKRDDSVKGAQMVQTKLAMARQKARHDNLATGVRFQPDTTLPGPPRYVTALQLIQQQMDLTGVGGATLKAPGAGNLVAIAGLNLSTVRPGDYVTINGNGVPHRIIGVDPGGGGLRLASNLGYPIPSTREFRITRQPALVAGERPTKLPSTIAVDLVLCSISDPAKPAMFTLIPGGIDLVFLPNGTIAPPWGGLDKVVFFVRDYMDPDVKTGGSPMVVSVQTRTGFVSVHPVDPFDAYARCLDPRASGF